MKKNTDFREILKFEFELRQKRNPRYSLRAFAELLDLSPSGLSQLFSGRQGLSAEKSTKIGKVLKWTEDEINFFIDLVQSKNARSKVQRDLAKLRLKQHHWGDKIMMEETFKVIADWHYFAILELTMVKGFKSEYEWIARALKIPLKTTKEAVATLMKLKLLKEENNKWIQTEEFLATTTEVPSDALKLFYTQLLKKAEEALFEQTVDERDFSSITMAIDKKDLKKAKAMIKDFRRQFMNELESSTQRDAVYALSVQFFKLSTCD